jgi:hypothetical protein
LPGGAGGHPVDVELAIAVGEAVPVGAAVAVALVAAGRADDVVMSAGELDGLGVVPTSARAEVARKTTTRGSTTVPAARTAMGTLALDMMAP